MLENKLSKIVVLGLSTILASCNTTVEVKIPCDIYLIQDTLVTQPDTLYRLETSEDSCPKYE